MLAHKIQILKFEALGSMLTSARVKLVGGLRSMRPAVRKMSEQVQAPKRDVLGIAFFSGICVLAGGLGVWQTQRYYWKVDLIQRIKSSTNEPPAVIGDCKSQEEFHNKTVPFRGQRVLLTGRFDHSREVFLGLRTAPASLTGGPAQGMASNPQGYYVITPFIREDGTTVYINRGWIPRKLYSQLQWQLSPESEGNQEQKTQAGKEASQQNDKESWQRPEGLVNVVVVMGEGEKASTFSPVNAVNTNILLWLEPASLLRAANAPSFEKETIAAEAFVPDSETAKSATKTGTNTATGAVPAQLPEKVETLVIADALGSDDAAADIEPVFPFVKPLAQLQEQIVAPETHFVYALTWFTLATAGLVMTFVKFRRGGAGAMKKRK